MWGISDDGDRSCLKVQVCKFECTAYRYYTETLVRLVILRLIQHRCWAVMKSSHLIDIEVSSIPIVHVFDIRQLPRYLGILRRTIGIPIIGIIIIEHK